MRSLGQLGENYACEFLAARGYRILERNWTAGKYEIDVIAMDGEVLVAVEVKARTHVDRGNPEAAVSPAQWSRIANCLGLYMDLIDHDWEVRFDIIAVTMNYGRPEGLNHYRDVYFPGRSFADSARE